MSAIQELRQRLDTITKFKEDGGDGYDPCIAFYTRLIDEIEDLHEDYNNMAERLDDLPNN